MGGKAPAKLLGHFQAQGLAAFGVEGAHVDIDEGPVVTVGDLTAETVYLVVTAVDGHDCGAVDGRADNLS